MQIKEMTMQDLVSKLVCMDKQRAELVKNINTLKAEVMARGLKILDDTNTRFIKFKSDEGSCSVTDAESLIVINDDKLKSLLPAGIYDKFVTITQIVDYKYDGKFERALKAIFNQNYTYEMSLEEFLDEMSVKPDADQKKVLIKKLKGDYEKDKNLMMSMFGNDDTQDDEFDVELFYINKIKNGELIKMFLPDECMDQQMEEIRKCMIVECSTKIGIEANK